MNQAVKMTPEQIEQRNVQLREKRRKEREDYQRQHKIALLKLLASDPDIANEFTLTQRNVVPQNCG